MSQRIVVAIPCYNEEAAIVNVIADFQFNLPEAEIHVFNNASTDRSAELAAGAGAVVHEVCRRGKGNVMRQILNTFMADAIIIVDGDGTYLAKDARRLLAPVLAAKADMAVGSRLENADPTALVQMHRFGNEVIVSAINLAFGTSFEDVLSGYRCLSRRFVEEVPLLTPGFETEVELTLQALEDDMEIVEIPISYRSRAANSHSKLRPFADGWRIIITIAMLLRDHYPLRFHFGAGGFLFILAAALLLGQQVLMAAFLGLVGFMVIGQGFLLNTIGTRFREYKQVDLRLRRFEDERRRK
ncbi:MAG: glycosyltransferase [Candidatus Omnitrophica bacterium]|nr:glycosyltransferase [Candidatus Omnitrophota bacterium]